MVLINYPKHSSEFEYESRLKEHMEKLELKIEGMHCGACATGIQMLTSQLDGVVSAFVDYEGKKGIFEYDPAKVTKEAIMKAIEELGYKASE